MEEQPNIKHIVISGGGIFGLSVYGALQELHKNGFWKFENIQSYYGTSVGSIVILFLLLEYDWETMETFLIKRPWDKVFNYDMKRCLELFENCGAFDISVFYKAIGPLFKAIDMDLNITMKELYEKTNKDFYIYTTELNFFNCECISHKTHPEWKVLEAIYASCSLPMIFRPLIKENKAYADGGLFLNYPLQKCLDVETVDKSEVLGIYKDFTNDEADKLLTYTSTMSDYFAVLLKNLIQFTNDRDIIDCKYQICMNDIPTSVTSLFDFVNSSDYRKNLFDIGKQHANQFLSHHGECASDDITVHI